MDIYKTIIVGIITGIITSCLIWLIIKLFKLLLIPWFQKVVYRGIDLNGSWTCNEEGSSQLNFEHSLEIKQSGHKVKGTLSIRNLIKNTNAVSRISNYNFHGLISDNCISISYYRKNNKTIGLGSYLLKVNHGGNALIGSTCFLTSGTEISSENNIFFERNKN